MHSLLFHPRVQVLEHRVLLTQVVVRNTNNSGPDSFRQAIIDVNKLPGGEIDFDIPGAGVHTIAPDPDDPLPTIDAPVVIDATTQPGYTPQTPVIELNGLSVGLYSGLILDGGDSTVKGMIINSFRGAGLVLSRNGNNTVMASFIGTDATGTIGLGNDSGIYIALGCDGNTIGGDGVSARNVLSGNVSNGISAFSNNDVVAGNFIGTDVTGTQPVGNDVGMVVQGDHNTIGGTSALSRNIISGNRFDGLELEHSTGNKVFGNFIGVDVTSTRLVSNGSGISISSASTNNTIGGTIPGSGNVISGNRLDGINIIAGSRDNAVQGNSIGTDFTRSIALPNGVGIEIAGLSNLIGGTLPAARNVISGNNNEGMRISGSLNLVEGNYIGTDESGMTSVPNGFGGVWLDGSGVVRNTTIGGTTAEARNVISGNGFDGIRLQSQDSQFDVENTFVQGNYIGTDALGTHALPNAGDGVIDMGGKRNFIGGGGTVNVCGNLISGNARVGVEISSAGSDFVDGNLIGTDFTASRAVPNGAGVAVNGLSMNVVIGGTLGGSRNIISGNATYGVAIFDRSASLNFVQANYIGTDVTGTQALSNDEGVDVLSGASVNWIQDNLVSGNTNEGIHIFDRLTTGNFIQSNYIGTDVTGTVALGNGYGVSITGGANGNTIGGTVASARNIISGNRHYGVGLLDSHTSSNVVQGNLIGTDVSGMLALGNGDDGILLPSGGLSGAANQNMIGGSGPEEGNRIAFNGLDGVRVDTGTGNSVRTNSIFGHFNGAGIRLVNGGNNNQATPRLRSATSDGTDTSIRGSLRSTPNTMFTLEFFSDPTCDPSGLGEGEVFLGTASVTTDGNGHARIRVDLPVPVNVDEFVTATATSPSGDTSEFSNCQVVIGTAAPDLSSGDDANLAAVATALPAADRSETTIPAALVSPNLDLAQTDRYFADLPANGQTQDFALLKRASPLWPTSPQYGNEPGSIWSDELFPAAFP
jgi:titin